MRSSRALLLSCATALGLALLVDAPPAGASNANRDILQEIDEDGADVAAIVRRLTKVTTILAKADKRLDALEAVFVDDPNILDGVDNPEILPPLELIHAQGEGILASVDAIDGGTSVEAVTRRLDRVGSTLAGASGRLDAIEAVFVDNPDLLVGVDNPDFVPALDAIIAHATSVLTAAEAIRSGAQPPPEGDVVPPEGDTSPPEGDIPPPEGD